MLTVIGDLLEDVVAWRGTALEHGADNPAQIKRTRGGSGANVASAAATLGPVKFIGRVGDDSAGEAVIQSLQSSGVCTQVQRAGVTGTVIILVDETGERTMIPDRGAAAELGIIDPSWIADSRWIHTTLYGLLTDSSRQAILTAVEQAAQLGIPVSIDLSDVSTIRSIGSDEVQRLIRSIDPAVVFANRQEADAAGLLELSGVVSGALVVKDGAKPITVDVAGTRSFVPVTAVDVVRDSTGAGDAFAAGYLTAAIEGRSPYDCAVAGSGVAARSLDKAGAL